MQAQYVRATEHAASPMSVMLSVLRVHAQAAVGAGDVSSDTGTICARCY